MERETGIEPASLAWKAKVLPLNYSRKAYSMPWRVAQTHQAAEHAATVDQESIWWRGLDSNQRRCKPADLQSAAINHSATSPR